MKGVIINRYDLIRRVDGILLVPRGLNVNSSIKEISTLAIFLVLLGAPALCVFIFVISGVIFKLSSTTRFL